MRLTKTVGQYLLGAGALDHIGQILAERVHGPQDRVVYLIDHYFKGNAMTARLPIKASDEVHHIDTTDEPTTPQVDALAAKLRAGDKPAVIVGIGGGATMDVAKAVANLLTNPGNAADYQSWDLVKNPGIFKIGVPTISGTGAEASRTCVMMNYEKNLKLGMNSDYTVYDRLVLDPELTATVPRNQYFYTGMDTYIHCIESLAGNYRHAFADAFSHQSLEMCRDLFLDGDMQDTAAREKLMVASFLGGSAIGNSFVGLVHPFSAGLSMVFHTHHCVGNCIALDAMEEFYPREVEEFRRMADRQKVDIPKGLCKNLTDAQRKALYDSTIIHEKPLANALGENFRKVLTFDKVVEVFERM